jgi:cysteinyl-tRNA synthetase
VLIAKEYATLMKMLDVMGFMFEEKKLSEEDIALYNDWMSYKKEKNFEKADVLRAQLIERGVL